MVTHYSFCLQILPFSILSWTQGANKTNHAKNYKLCLAQYLTFSEVIKVHLKNILPVAATEHCGNVSVISFSSVRSHLGLGASLREQFVLQLHSLCQSVLLLYKPGAYSDCDSREEKILPYPSCRFAKSGCAM